MLALELKARNILHELMKLRNRPLYVDKSYSESSMEKGVLISSDDDEEIRSTSFCVELIVSILEAL